MSFVTSEQLEPILRRLELLEKQPLALSNQIETVIVKLIELRFDLSKKELQGELERRPPGRKPIQVNTLLHNKEVGRFWFLCLTVQCTAMTRANIRENYPWVTATRFRDARKFIRDISSNTGSDAAENKQNWKDLLKQLISLADTEQVDATWAREELILLK